MSDPTSAPTTVRALARDYLISRRVGPTQNRVLNKLVHELGNRRVDQITPVWVQSYNQKSADATRRRELGALRTLLRWAEAQARDFHDAALAYPKFGGRVAIFVALGLNTGARKEAIEGLTWDRVDFKAGAVDYREPGRAVSKKRRVPVPMNDRLKGVLEWARDNPVDGSNYVLGECSIRYPYECFVRDIGMSWVTPHVLRHTCATLMLRKGLSIWDVAGVLGDHPNTVARVYGHHSTTHLRAAVAALA
jgi:integrase